MLQLYHIHSPKPLGGISVPSCLFQLLPTVFPLSESSSSKKKAYYIQNTEWEMFDTGNLAFLNIKLLFQVVLI